MGFTKILNHVKLFPSGIPGLTPQSGNFYPQDIAIILNQLGASAFRLVPGLVLRPGGAHLTIEEVYTILDNDMEQWDVLHTNSFEFCNVMVGVTGSDYPTRAAGAVVDPGDLLDEAYHSVALPCPPFDSIPPGEQL